jgi:hypothetical protein
MTVLCRRDDAHGANYGHINESKPMTSQALSPLLLVALTKMYTSFYIPAMVVGSYFMFMQEEYLRQGQPNRAFYLTASLRDSQAPSLWGEGSGEWPKLSVSR